MPNTPETNQESDNSASEVECKDLLAASMSLLGKLRIVHSSPEYKGVWAIAQAHSGPYEGIQYVDEMDDLEKAIEAEHAKIFPKVFEDNV